ncbi:response regulator [Spirosoma aureum]|uniref:histidine kinase n=1 Tax=Spirosoma aureum TaxID=2692134 RepID=A0A6G9AMX9_9BACT|nr:ATP-binding protein [Spirosoma aureum]QIP13699.1 response regulator [Spirosoma aureum]
MRTFFFIFLSILSSMTLLGQPKAQGWKELTISEGLSQGMIYDLKQDRQGFIWVATKDGLNRYDGHNFTVFSHDPYNEFSLSDNTCSALLVDSRGRLWVGTLNRGLNLYDAQTQRFYHIDISDQHAANSGNYEVRLLAEDLEGNIWVNTDQDKLFKITLPNELKTSFPRVINFTNQAKFQQITLIGMATNASAHHIQFRANGTATVGTTYGMCLFNWQQMTGMRSIYRPLNIPQKDWSLVDDTGEGGYWFSAMNTTIHGWLGATHKTIRLPSQTTSVLVKMIDSNTVAVATSEYLWLLSPDQLLAQESLTPQNAFTAMPPDMFGLRTLNRDKTGLIWIGTAGYGLRVFNPKVKQFKTYLPSTSLTYLTQDQQGHLYARYLSTYGRVDRATNKLLPFLKGFKQSNDHHEDFLLQSKASYFWASTIDFGVTGKLHQLLKYSSTGELLKRFPLPAQTAFGVNQNQTFEDKAGQLWIGATNGKLLRFDPKTEDFTVFDYRHLLPQSGAEIEVYALYFDRAGTLWIGTPSGLVRCEHPQTKPAFVLYKNSATNQQSLSNDVVSCMVDDPNQPARYLWVSTKGGGLERLDKRTGLFQHFTETQGLPNKVVYGLLVDEFKNLWMSTNRGLAQFNPRTYTFRTYAKVDGLQDDEFNTGSYVKTASGELLFGGVNGITAFRAGDVAGKSVIPNVHIVGLKINNEPVVVGGGDGILPASIENTSGLDLAYDQNLITLEFAVMNFTNPARNRYRYRMVGIDPDWVEAGTNRFANYAQLPNGHYTLQMMGSADGEVWSKPVELAIQVHPPFYRTWWAYLFYILMLAVLGWLLYRFQKQRWLLQQQVSLEKQEASRLAELDALKTQFFANISHEFRTPLTLILGPVEQMAQEYAHDGRFPLLQRNANRLLSLINQLLDLSKLEAGQLRAEPEPGDMAAFFRLLTCSFSSLAESRRIKFTVTQNEPERWVSFDRDKVEKIVTNLLANAFKFTPAGNAVSIRVQYPEQKPNPLIISVSDTGIGIEADKLPHIFERFYQGSIHTGSVHTGGDGKNVRPYEGTGIGLALVHELVKVLGGSISVASTEGVGTTFTVKLPLVASGIDTVPLRARSGSGSAQNPLVVADGSYPVEWPVETKAPLVTTENILLIIDDNADIRAYIRSIFAADYQILEAENGQDGLEKATASLPDIVICDLMMPRLDGFGFCKALKSHEATSHIPVMMLTAKATVDDRIEGFELGADDYLTKPFNRGEIRARVKNLVQQRQRLYQRFAANLTTDVAQLAPLAEPVGPVEPVILAAEQKFLDRLTVVVNQNLSNPNFGVETLADAIGLSRAQLYRKLKALTNTTAIDFIRELRLAKAADLLTQGEESVTQIAYAVGFENLSYFAKVFQERYGVLPSQYGLARETPTGSKDR